MALTDRSLCVEHTLIEVFGGQRANVAKIEHLLVPIKQMLVGLMPGYFDLAFRERDTSAAQVGRNLPHVEIAMLVLEAATRMSPGETVTLCPHQLPFEIRLHLRHQQNSGIVLNSDIDGVLCENSADAGSPDNRRIRRNRRRLVTPKLGST